MRKVDFQSTWPSSIACHFPINLLKMLTSHISETSRSNADPHRTTKVLLSHPDVDNVVVWLNRSNSH